MAPDSKRLEELILYGEVEEALSLVTLDEVADAWCRYQARPHVPGVEEDDPDWWSVDLLLGGQFYAEEQRQRTLLDLLIERAQDDELLGAIGAGPLENFITNDDDRLAWIEQRAAGSDRFREALRNVWIWHLQPEAFARVELAAGEELARSGNNQIDFVPGDLPGTVHITVNGVTASEIETEPDDVEDMIDRLRSYTDNPNQT